ncbi:MAG: LptF/LptG family permease [Verrucomicrobia bacterium]|nr:LptF/LptG family permease [Verrucomicrobiota bacterium]
MRLLDRYLLRELVTPLAFCLGGFLVFWISFDLFDKLNVLQEHKLHAGDVIAYELVRLPEFLGVVLPVALLLAALYSLTQHARHHELTAIRAAGVSLWRLAAPYLAVGVAASSGLFAGNEFWSPRSAEMAERILYRYSRGWTAKTNPFEKVYFVTRSSQKWSADFNQQTRELREVNIDWQKPDGSRVGFFAKGGIWTNRVWVFSNVQMNVFRAGGLFPENRVFTNVMAMPEFAETPEQIMSDLKISQQSRKVHVELTQIPFSALYNYLRLHPEMPAEQRRWVTTQMHSRLAVPWTCLVVVMLAIPFGAASGRRNVFVGVAGSVFICFTYFVLQQVGLAMGAGGQVPPWLGAWLPNIFFGAAGLILTFRVR